MTASARRSASRTTTRVGLRSDQVYLKLKEALIAGDYKAGERLQIEEIALSEGVSRQPVMDAVRRLESEGLLTVVPQVGTMVPTVGIAEVQDFFEYHARTEAFFCELAARRRTDEEAAELLAVVDRYRRPKPKSREPSHIARRYRLHNREFHGLIHVMARSPLLHQTAVALWDRSDLYISTMSPERPFAEREVDAITEHRSIAQAIADRDPVGAADAAAPHILNFLEMVRSSDS